MIVIRRPILIRPPRLLALVIALVAILLVSAVERTPRAFAQAPAPTITSVSPSSGPLAGGTTVTLTGTNFIAGAQLFFGSTASGSVVVTSATQLTAITPSGQAGPVALTLVNPDGVGTSLLNGFTYGSGSSGTVAPGGTVSVTSVTPGTGPASGGTVVTISGTGFQANASVLIGLVPATAVVVVSSTQITATTPANSVATSALSVTVVNPGGVSGSISSAFSYGASGGPFTVAGITPTLGSASGGTQVTITGSGLSAVTSVMFGGTAGSNLSITSDNTLSIKTPARATGSVAVTVVTASGSSITVPNAFVYNASATVTLVAVAPSVGSRSGGTTVTLTGTGFVTGMTVTMGGTAATNLAVTSSTQATAVTPARSSNGAVDVVVAITSGETATLAGGFVYQDVANPPIQLPASGFGLFVFGGSNAQLVTASGCPVASAAFYATNSSGVFVAYVPGTSIAAVNAAWNALFPSGVPSGTALIGKCS